ncbi:MAG: stage III sporulation protein AE [Roseburia sp.]|nr:stage III sporulation protein AE [Roseburia sp.]
MKKTVIMLIMTVLLAGCAAICAVFSVRADGNAPSAAKSLCAYARNADGDSDDIPDSIDDLLDKLDLSDVQSLVDALSETQISVFGFSDIKERIRAVANGDYAGDFGSVLSYVFALFGADIFEYLPMLFAIIAIAIAYNLLNSVKGRYASESIERVVYFATGTLAVSLIVGYFSSLLGVAVRFVGSMKTQINAVAPVLITLMTATGASASAGVYSPAVAILGGAMTNAVTYFAFPALLMAMVFDVIGSVSTGIKLEKTAEFFRSACKWLLGTAFFLFIAVIGVTGITASVRDGISMRAARFAVSKYVPVIGGYLSQGFDFIMAGNVLIKNALGSGVVLLIALGAAPVISKLVIFTLTLKLTAAIAEPLGGDRFSGILTSVSKSSSMIATVVIAMTFLYIIFISMTICTGNIGL